jgi:hypothetical protein
MAAFLLCAGTAAGWSLIGDVFTPFGQIRDLLLQSPQCLLDQPTARGEWDRISFVGYGRKVSKTKRLVQSRPHPFLRRVNSLIRGLPVSPKRIIEDVRRFSFCLQAASKSDFAICTF